jgi:hypothetical protein
MTFRLIFYALFIIDVPVWHKILAAILLQPAASSCDETITTFPSAVLSSSQDFHWHVYSRPWNRFDVSHTRNFRWFSPWVENIGLNCSVSTKPPANENNGNPTKRKKRHEQARLIGGSYQGQSIVMRRAA